jgi:hypothetical protein
VSARINVRLAVLATALTVCCACSSLANAQDRISNLRSRLSQEPDPIRKAKLMPDLGNAEFQEIEKDFQADKLSEALIILKQYRDEARSCTNDLDAKNIDAEKHPTGFKQLQFSLRASLRRLSDLLVTLTRDEQEPFEGARKDIEDMDRHLIHELFPRQPAGEEPKTKT